MQGLDSIGAHSSPHLPSDPSSNLPSLQPLPLEYLGGQPDLIVDPPPGKKTEEWEELDDPELGAFLILEGPDPVIIPTHYGPCADADLDNLPKFAPKKGREVKTEKTALDAPCDSPSQPSSQPNPHLAVIAEQYELPIKLNEDASGSIQQALQEKEEAAPNTESATKGGLYKFWLRVNLKSDASQKKPTN